ncbi:hypothetical protein AB205_0044690 [Aquarana catesbeiana]|uniref:Uncharacterized protein n=1 Tax=Aquarana catesbeiana TaxID=8400 RepID=A0A2G9Q9N2_AQUCT|nr:hypothetical protein AB205_0044690 [Aquarana catesbeiana]
MFHIPIYGLKYLCVKYTFCFILIGEKRPGTSEDTRNPNLLKKGNRGHHRMSREERWMTWLKLSPQQVSDVHVVEEQAPHFTSASTQILIQEIMVCS